MVLEFYEGDGRMLDLTEVKGLGEYSEQQRKVSDTEVDTLYLAPNEKAFLVVRPKTIEVRCDGKLGRVLREKYESVMESRYFGRGGIEIVPSGQLEEAELQDLVRLSYNLTKELQD